MDASYPFHASKISFAKCEILHVCTQTKLINSLLLYLYFKSVLYTYSFFRNKYSCKASVVYTSFQNIFYYSACSNAAYQYINDSEQRG